jgi:hypothetical protein
LQATVTDACPLEYSALVVAEPVGQAYVVLAEDGVEISGMELADDARAPLQFTRVLISIPLAESTSEVKSGKGLAAGQAKYPEPFVTRHVTISSAILVCEPIIFVGWDVDATGFGSKTGVL